MKKYYSIHICLQDTKDGIFYHIPIHFNTTTDWEVAKENFRKACNQMFRRNEDYKVEEFPHDYYLSTPLRAIGQVGSEYNGRTQGPSFYGKFMVSLTEYTHKPGFEDNL